MNVIERKLLWSVFKWTAIAVVVWYLYQIGFFTFVFVGLPWLLTYVGGLIVEYGLGRVLSYYKGMWALVFILLGVLSFLVFELFYRVKRKDFVIGGQFEGRVVWIKGMRVGLAYAVWDLYNYIMWRAGKKKDADSRFMDLSKPMATFHGIARWPNPLAFPIGPKVRNKYVFYVRRRWFQIIPEKWFIPTNTTVGVLLNAYTIPNGHFVRWADPEVPGRWTFHVVDEMPKRNEIDPKELTKRNRILLGRSGKMVDKALLSDGETKKLDFTHGSFNIPQLQEDEGAYDD